jgi:aminopeptidase YwaD
MKKYFVLLVLIICCTIDNSGQTPDNSNFVKYINYLASDSLEGRLAGTRGADKAADFIIGEMKSMGLKPYKNNFKQEFDVVTAYTIDSSTNIFAEKLIPRAGLPKEQWKKMKQSWKLNLDYIPLATSSNSTATGNVLFACYGITAADLNYDDYAGVDAKGKIVIVMMDSPEPEDKCVKFCNYTSMNYKIKNAKDHGAIAVVFLRKQGNEMNKFIDLKWKYFGDGGGFPVIQVNRTFITKYIPPERNLMRLEDRVDQAFKPESFDLGDMTLTITTKINPVKSKTNNILGMVEGKDPVLKNEIVVVGAHYDHIGFGGGGTKVAPAKQDRVHNGANDNASSVAAVLELARFIKDNPLRRTVVFAAFSAEEMGSLGANYFVDNLGEDASKCVAMVNLEMVGKNDKAMYAMSSSSSTAFPPILDSAAVHNGITLTHSQRAVPSDHSPFLNKGIPAIIVFGGFSEDYHTPLDDANKISYSAVRAAYNLTKEFVFNLDLLDKKPEFNPNK